MGFLDLGNFLVVQFESRNLELEFTFFLMLGRTTVRVLDCWYVLLRQLIDDTFFVILY